MSVDMTESVILQIQSYAFPVWPVVLASPPPSALQEPLKLPYRRVLLSPVHVLGSQGNVTMQKSTSCKTG